MTERPPVEPDDLAGWADDDLVRALRAPGSATELADQQQYVAAFRGAHRSNVRSLPRRAVGRLGAGGTAVVVTVALTSGVAAAYTGHLPDPVQRIAHTVLGAPAPDTGVRHRPSASGPQGGPASGGPASPGSTASSAPTDAPSTGPTSSPDGPDSPGATAPTGGHHHRVRQSSSDAPSSSTSPSPTAGAPAASAMSMSAPAHRVGLGQTMTLTGLVTDATGSALPGHDAVLQQHVDHQWQTVVETTADSAGVVSAATPAITRSTRFRWSADQDVTSTPWLVRMVPTLTLTADVGGSTTVLSPSAQGSGPADRIQVLRHRAGRTTLIRRARLDASGSAQVSVVTPRRRTAYVVRLLGTKRHAPARARVVVLPPQPAALTVTGSTGRVGPGGTAVIGGTVTSADGDVLAGHRVVLMRRGPARWRPVGHAVSDSTGHVSIATPPITATTRFRLRTDHAVHSGVWRVVEVPIVHASAERGGTNVTITASSTGAHAGDQVVLLRRFEGRLVRMRQSRLGSGGGVTFSVPARKARTTYVVRVVATKHHAAATASVVVPRAAG